MRVKVAGTLTAAQQGALHRAKAYHGKQPHTEFFADCVIWYKNDWAVIIPMQHTVPYYWAGGSNTTLTNPTFAPAVDTSKSTNVTVGGVTTITMQQNPYPYDGGVGAFISVQTATTITIGYGSWFNDGVAFDPTIPPTPYGVPVMPARIPGVHWQRLNGSCQVSSTGPTVISNTLAWTAVDPSYELITDSAAWNAVLLAQHTAVIDTFRNATPPAVSVSPATSVTVTVAATSASAYVRAVADAPGCSSAGVDSGVVIVASTPLDISLVPYLDDAEDEVLVVEFYQDGMLVATLTEDPFIYDVTMTELGTFAFTAFYTDASDNTEEASLTIEGVSSYVEIFRGGVLLSTITEPPYAYSDESLAEGVYTYSAVGHNDAGDAFDAEVTLTAVGPALTGDALSSIATVVPVNGRAADAEHAYARPYFDGTFWKRGGVACLVPLSTMAGSEERGMYYDLRLDDDLTGLKIDGYVKLRCGDATDLTAPITIIEWVPVTAATLPITGSFPRHIVRVTDAVTYGAYPIFGWWYDEVEQIQKADMALDPAPTFQIALFDFVRDTMS